MKKFVCFIITVLISVAICLLCISLSLKEIVINTLSKQVVKSEITNKVIETLKDKYNNIDYDTLDEIETNIGNSQSINKITEKYFENITDSIVDNKDVKLPDTKEEILNIINENQYILTEKGINITNEQKNIIASELIDNNVIDKLYQKVAGSIKDNMSKEEIMVVNVYDKITKPSFRWIMVSIIIVSTLIIALIKRTYYRWTYNLGVSFAISAIILSFLSPTILDMFSLEITNKIIGNPSEININSLINLGYVCFALCALLIIIYIVINKITNYNKKYE